MKITTVEQQPRRLVTFPLDNEKGLTDGNLEHLVEIFNTPLTGAYTWDYRIQDDRIQRLYELGKQLNWNASIDIDWSQTAPPVDDCAVLEQLERLWGGFAAFDAMNSERRLEYARHRQAWALSQFLHGEQGALLVASQLVSCAPTYNAKLYAGSQVFDEARHVEVFNRYIQQRTRLMYPIGTALKSILDKILTDARWDLKFIGMQIIIEGLALAAFNTMREFARDPVLRDLLSLVIRDEARHVTFGVNYLEQFVQLLSEEEREERARFAYEVCVISRERLVAVDVFAHFGWDPEAARRHSLEHNLMEDFQRLLFVRVIPNLKRIGLLTDAVRPNFQRLGVLQFEDSPDDGEIDWAELSLPLYQQSATG